MISCMLITVLQSMLHDVLWGKKAIKHMYFKSVEIEILHSKCKFLVKLVNVELIWKAAE